MKLQQVFGSQEFWLGQLRSFGIAFAAFSLTFLSSNVIPELEKHGAAMAGITALVGAVVSFLQRVLRYYQKEGKQ